jgi:competence protein ComEA
MRRLILLPLCLLLLIADDSKKLPEGPGRKTTERLCGACHGFGNFVKRRETRDGWNDVIEDMIRRGAKGEEEEWAEVSDYLVAQFPAKQP